MNLFSFFPHSPLSKKNNNVITYTPYSIHKVITFINTHPFFRNTYNVITYLTKRDYIVYTSLFFLLQILPITAQAIELKRPITQGSLIYGRASQNERVFFQDIELKQNKDGLFVLALPQDTSGILILTTKKDGKTQNWSLPIEKRTWTEEIVNGLPPQKVTPSPENEKRIARENALVQAGRADTFYTTLPVCFQRPVTKTARISSTFGARRILNGQKTAGHSGTDYALPIGTPITSPADGIIKVIHPDMFLTGKTILIDHGFGLYSSYSHLNQLNVTTGQHVKQGDKIGEVGMTGRSTGPHLHLVMTWFNTRVDPEFIFQKYGCAK